MASIKCKVQANLYTTVSIVTVGLLSVLVSTPPWLFLYLLLTRDEVLFTHYMLGGYCCTWSHSVTLTQSIELLWTRDRPVAEISTWQQTTLTKGRQPCPVRNLNLQSQKASGRRPMS